MGRPKFNQLEMVTIFTYKSSLVMIGERNFELYNTIQYNIRLIKADRTQLVYTM